MRRYTIWIAAAMAAASCEPSHLNDNMYEPAVYFVNGGLTRETIYSVEGSHTVQVHAYCGGIESIDPEVVVEVDRSALDTYNINTGESLEFLPESCYTIESAPKKMSGNRVTFDIVFDCQKLEELSQQDDFSDLEGYAVPVMLRSLTEGVMVAGDADLCSAVIIPDMEMMGFTFEQAGVKSVDLTEFSDADGFLTYEYRLSTPVENHWDNPVRFIFPAESPDAEYGPLPEGSYTVTQSAEQFTDGVSEIIFTVKIDKDAATAFNYSLVAQVESGGSFVMFGDGTSVLNLTNRYTYDQSAITAVADTYVQGRGADLTLDGDLSTLWECAYNTSSTHVGLRQMPYTLTYTLEEPVMLYDIRLDKRSDRYVTDLKAGYFEASLDGEAYTRVIDVDYGSSTQASWIHSLTEPMEAKYVRFVATESNRRSGNYPLASIAEMNFYYR